jgi:hypothetical protein
MRTDKCRFKAFLRHIVTNTDDLGLLPGEALDIDLHSSKFLGS